MAWFWIKAGLQVEKSGQISTATVNVFPKWCVQSRAVTLKLVLSSAEVTTSASNAQNTTIRVPYSHSNLGRSKWAIEEPAQRGPNHLSVIPSLLNQPCRGQKLAYLFSSSHQTIQCHFHNWRYTYHSSARGTPAPPQHTAQNRRARKSRSGEALLES